MHRARHAANNALRSCTQHHKTTQNVNTAPHSTWAQHGTQNHTEPYSTTQHHNRHTGKYRTTPSHCTTQHHTAPHSTTQHHTAPQSIIQYKYNTTYIDPHYTTQNSTKQHRKTPNNTRQHRTAHGRRKRGGGGGLQSKNQRGPSPPPQKWWYFSIIFLTYVDLFLFSNIFKIKWPKSKEKLYFGRRWAWVPMNPSPQTQLRGDALDTAEHPAGSEKASCFYFLFDFF